MLEMFGISFAIMEDAIYCKELPPLEKSKFASSICFFCFEHSTLHINDIVNKYVTTMITRRLFMGHSLHSHYYILEKSIEIHASLLSRIVYCA